MYTLRLELLEGLLEGGELLFVLLFGLLQFLNGVSLAFNGCLARLQLRGQSRDLSFKLDDSICLRGQRCSGLIQLFNLAVNRCQKRAAQ